MKLIKINEVHFILTDDSEIKVGDWIFYPVTKAIFRWDGNTPLRNEDLKLSHSTIGYMFQDDILPLNLEEVEELIYGYSVKEMAKDLNKSKCRNFKREYTLKETYEGIEDGFVLGFKAHQELVRDKFILSEKEIENIIKASLAFKFDNDSISLSILTKSMIEFLSPKKEWEVEFKQDKLIYDI